MEPIVANRRTLLRGLGLGVIAAAGTMSAGCTATPSSGGGATGSAASPGARAASRLPGYFPVTSVKADLPAAESGAPAGFFRYPPTLPQLHDAKPVTSGGPVTILQAINTPPPVPQGQNTFWQELNNRVGAELQFTHVPGSEYAQKFATTIAGGDLPDLMTMQVVQQLPAMLKAKFQPLTELLAGDAVKDYPALANMRPYAWPNMVFDGELWGIPYSNAPAGGLYFVRQDLFDAKGLSLDISSGDEFLQLCRDITDASTNRYALYRAPVEAITLMMGIPNQWGVDNGKFVRDIEHPRYEEALSVAARLVKENLVFPGKPALADLWAKFGSGSVAITTRNGYDTWTNLPGRVREVTPSAVVNALVLPKWDGGGDAGQYAGSGVYRWVALKKTTDDRARELLRLLDYLASPFGTAESLFVDYGLEGEHYTMKDGSVTRTAAGTAQVSNMQAGRLVQNERPIFIPSDEESTRKAYELVHRVMKNPVSSAAVGLYSETEVREATKIETELTALSDDIISGRSPVSEWKAAVAKWRSAGGDTIRAELEEAQSKAVR